MAVSDSALTIQTTIAADDKNIKVKDTYDYVSESIALTDVRGLVKITHVDTGEVVQEGTDWASPDIDHDSSLETTTFDLPLDDDDAVLNGDYSVLYKARVDDLSINGQTIATSGNTITLIGDYSGIVVGSTITVSGSSAGNDGDYTVVSATYDGSSYTAVVVTEALTGNEGSGFSAAADVVFEKTFTYTYEFTIPTVSITQLHSCSKGTFTSTDATEYSGTPVIVRSHTIKYPQGLGATQPADVVVTDKTHTVGPPIYTTNWTTVISNDLTFTQTTDDLVVTCTITGSKDHEVTCSTSLCDVRECYEKLVDGYEAKRACNPTMPSNTPLLVSLANLINLMNIQEDCGKQTDAQATADTIIDLLKANGCTDCSDDSDSPVKVDPNETGTSTTADKVSYTYAASSGAWSVQDTVEKALNYIRDNYKELPDGTQGRMLRGKSDGEYELISPSRKYQVPTYDGSDVSYADIGSFIDLVPESQAHPGNWNSQVPADFFAQSDDAVEFSFLVKNADASSTVGIRIGATTYASLNVNSFTGWVKFFAVRTDTDELTIYGIAENGNTSSGTASGLNLSSVNTLRVWFNAGSAGTFEGAVSKPLKVLS